MNMTIRPETPADHCAVERLTWAAFETMSLPGRTHTNEHYLAHILRDAAAYVPALDFVGEVEGQIVANIMYSKSKIIRPYGEATDTLTFGPVSVQPALHRQGLGAQLIAHSLDKARSLGYGAVIIMGHPAYYARFGFVPASQYKLSLSNGEAFAAFMALELMPGYLGMEGGVWMEDPIFDVDPAAFAAWHSTFQAP